MIGASSQLKTYCTWVELLPTNSSQIGFGVLSPTGLLQKFANMVPANWLEKLRPLNQSPPANALYIPVEADKRSNIHSISIKMVYSQLESKKKFLILFKTLGESLW